MCYIITLEWICRTQKWSSDSIAVWFDYSYLFVLVQQLNKITFGVVKWLEEKPFKFKLVWVSPFTVSAESEFISIQFWINSCCLFINTRYWEDPLDDIWAVLFDQKFSLCERKKDVLCIPTKHYYYLYSVINLNGTSYFMATNWTTKHQTWTKWKPIRAKRHW